VGLAAFSPERFVTLVAALVSPEQRELRYVNAGHPAPALWGDGREPIWLESTGPLVSPVLRSSTWEAPVLSIDPGDHLLIYTDGVSDALADEDGRAEQRSRARSGGWPEAARRSSTRFSPTSVTTWPAGRRPTISRC
jgi:serine phosphatase RsbU (regulator of sigma subunit)